MRPDLAAFKERDWLTSQPSFLDSLSRPISSPATRRLAAAHASVVCRHWGNAESEYLRSKAKQILAAFWIRSDLDSRLKGYIRDAEVADLILDVARKAASR